MTPREQKAQRNRVAAAEGAMRHPDVYPRANSPREAVHQAMPNYVELDGVEADFLAGLLLRAWQRDNALSDAERALVMELRERIRPAYSRERAIRDLTR